MKKLYYFSQSKLQFVEIKNYKRKLALLLVGAVFICSSILIGGYSVIYSLTNQDFSLSSLQFQNDMLKNKLMELKDRYTVLNNQLDSLTQVNNELRIAANLPPISGEERMLGIGGSPFDNSFDFLNNESDLKLNNALSYIEEVTRKIEFEKSQYIEISDKLLENKKLFEALPAIKPSIGTISAHGFGMRLHPILNIRRMHEGIDIITDVGTSVHAAGKGTVEFVGYRGGYGLAVEIDHGFGYRTLYAHLSAVRVKEGQRVQRGDLIAKSGNTGLSAGPHLHYEVHHNGIKQNPIEFFFDDMGFIEFKSKK